MIVVIEGEPIAKKRSRTFLLKGKICHYNSQSNQERDVKNIMLDAIREAFNGGNRELAIEASNLANGTLFEVTLTFCMPIPKSFSKSKKKAILDGSDHYNNVPDVDNLVKFYLDCANEILFPDDRFIVALHAKKVYSENPRTIMEVKPF